MSNSITASETTFIELRYNGGVRTLISNPLYISEYVVDIVKRAIKDFIEQYEFKKSKNLEPLGIVWYIDEGLNGAGLVQGLFDGEIKNVAEIINIPFYYDLGENEEEEEIQKVFPNYVYKENYY